MEAAKVRRVSLLAAAAHFAALANDPLNELALAEAARIVQEEAQQSLGTYQDAVGPFPAWAPLAEATREERERKGFTPDDPLLRSGGLRDSIEVQIDGDHAYIGSNHDAAAPMEYGTGTIPARSFLGSAAYRKAGEISEVIGNDLVKRISGQ